MIAAVLTVAVALAAAQTTLDDVQSALLQSWGRVDNIEITADCHYAAGDTHRISVVLAGKPRWRLWRYHLRSVQGGFADEHINAFDGREYWRLQDDGLGSRLREYNAPHAYMAYFGIYLGNLGIGSEATGDNWVNLFARAKLTLMDDPARPGSVCLMTPGLRRELDSRVGFMPTSNVFLDRDGRERLRIDFSDYQEMDGVWLPLRAAKLGAPDNPFSCQVRSFRVNQAIAAEDLRIAFPYGTSVLHEGDGRTYVAGESSVSEAEAALQNWLLYGASFGRSPAQTAAELAAERRIVSAKPGDLAAMALNLGIVGAALLWRIWIRRGRGSLAAAVLTAMSAGSALAATRDGEAGFLERGDARCAYVVLALYGRDVSLAEVVQIAEADGRDASLAAAARVLAVHRIATRVCSLMPGDLESWPFPAVLELHSRARASGRRFAVCVAFDGARFTLIDPNRYGRLEPWTSSELASQWTGRVLLTSPVPVDLWRPWRIAAWLSVPGPLLVALAAWRRSHDRRRRAAAASAALAAAVVSVLLMSGCDHACDSTAPGSRDGLTVDPPAWTVEATYPVTLKRTFTIVNRTSSSISLQNVRPSCGCIASGLPVGQGIPPSSSQGFELAIDLSNSRGPVHHTIRLDFSNGATHTIDFRADVRRGICAEPAQLRLDSHVPGELSSAEVRLQSDDGSAFEITGVDAPWAHRVEYDNSTKVVTLHVLHDNRRPTLRESLTVLTSHPHAAELHVPVFVSFALTWEIRPTGFYLRSTSREPIERTVEFRSRNEVPFLVLPDAVGGVLVRPQSATPAPIQTVRLKLDPPVVGGAPVRIVAKVRTTLPDAQEIEVPFVFYP